MLDSLCRMCSTIEFITITITYEINDSTLVCEGHQNFKKTLKFCLNEVVIWKIVSLLDKETSFNLDDYIAQY